MWLRSSRCTALRITDWQTRQRIEQTPLSGETVCKVRGTSLSLIPQTRALLSLNRNAKDLNEPSVRNFRRVFQPNERKVSAPAPYEGSKYAESRSLRTKGDQNIQFLVKTSRFFLPLPELGQAELARLGAELIWRHDPVSYTHLTLPTRRTV